MSHQHSEYQQNYKKAVEDYSKTMEMIQLGKFTKSYAKTIINDLKTYIANMHCTLMFSSSQLRECDLYEPYKYAFSLLNNLYNLVQKFLESS